MDQNLKLKKINICVVGGSFDSTIANTHLKSILSTNKFQIICGCFTKNKKKNNANSKFYSLNKKKIYNNLTQLIKYEKKYIDLALVLTPPKNRNKIYSLLAKNNIGIIAEKPFEGNYAISKKIYKYLKKKNSFFVTTYNYLGYPAIMEIKSLLKKIGKINNFYFQMPQQASTLKNSKIKKWRLNDLSIPNLHLDLASHLISMIIYFFNELPLKVNSFSTKNKKKNYVENVYTWMRFKNFIGQIWFSKNATGKRNEISLNIFGSKGSLSWQHKNPEEINLYDDRGNIFILNRLSKNLKFLNDKKLFTYSPGHPSGFLDAFINIYNSIHNYYIKKKKPQFLLGLKENLDIIKVLSKIHKSSLTNKWESIQKK